MEQRITGQRITGQGFTGHGFGVDVVSLSALAAQREDWAALARAAIEPNPFYEPEFLGASIQHLERADAVSLLVVRETRRDNRLVALLPLQRPRLREGLLFGAQSLYTNAYSSLSTPLVHADCAAEALHAAFEFLAHRTDLPPVLHFPMLGEKREFAALLRAQCAHAALPVETVSRFERTAIETTLSQPAYAQRLRRATRKALGQKQRRLAALGALRFDTIFNRRDEAGEALPGNALEEFLELEASGWKGRRGTALASHAKTRAFALAAFANTSWLIERLSLDERALAMNLNLISGGAAFTIKTAYDEAFSAYSPGTLLDWQMVGLITEGRPFGGAPIRRADSCAHPAHRIGQLWLEREPIVSLLVAVSPAVALERLARMASRMRRMARGIDVLRGWRERFHAMRGH